MPYSYQVDWLQNQLEKENMVWTQNIFMIGHDKISQAKVGRNKIGKHA